MSDTKPVGGDVTVVGLGMACLDILVRGNELPTWEHGVRFQAISIDGGGPVATAIVAAQRLGVSAGMVGTYGSDRLGTIKLETLLENGVDVSRMVCREGPENQAVLVTVQESTGERVFSGFAHSIPQLVPAELDREYITSARYLHLDGFHSTAALQAARWMHAAGKQVMLDGSATRGPIWDGMQALVREVDILICGSGFGPALTGQTDPYDAGRAILKIGPRIVVQTEGKAGSYTVTAGESFHTPAFEVPVVDTTGAGDVFHGAYLAGLLHGWDVRSIALFSTAVSAIKCTRLGGRAGIPSFAQALAFLSEREIYLTPGRDNGNRLVLSS
jgi:ribokinase